MKTITIGRLPDNDIVIQDDGLVSRHHSKITCDDSGIFRIVDLNSKNGTYVNNRKITAEVILSVKDVVKIGNTVLPWISYFQTDKLPEKTIDKQKSMLDTEIGKDDEKKIDKMTYSWVVKK